MTFEGDNDGHIIFTSWLGVLWFGKGGRPKMLWLGSPNGTFSVSRAWEDIRNRSTQVPWYRVVWFKGKVPRHALILWLAVKKKET